MKAIKLRLQTRIPRAISRYLLELVKTLTPAWWVIRAYLIVVALGAISWIGWGGIETLDLFPIPYLFMSRELAVLAIVLAIPISVALGRKRFGIPLRLVFATLNIAIAVVGYELIKDNVKPRTYSSEAIVQGQQFGASECLYDRFGEPISNLYVYDEKGSLIPRAFVYDQEGNAVANVCFPTDVGTTARAFEDQDGRLITNMYPLQPLNEVDGTDSTYTPPTDIKTPTEIKETRTPFQR